MKEDLCKGLRCGDLLAYGMSEGSRSDENPVRIPAHLFPIAGDQGPSVLDWEGSALSWPNGRFVRIRVTKPAVRASRRSGSRRDGKSSQETNDNARPSPGKRGRFPVGELLRTIVQTLSAGIERKNAEGTSSINPQTGARAIPALVPSTHTTVTRKDLCRPQGGKTCREA